MTELTLGQRIRHFVKARRYRRKYHIPLSFHPSLIGHDVTQKRSAAADFLVYPYTVILVFIINLEMSIVIVRVRVRSRCCRPEFRQQPDFCCPRCPTEHRSVGVVRRSSG